ncbi:hypothetical protein [Spiroplasma endosymbiont of Lasioglossum malachurum]
MNKDSLRQTNCDYCRTEIHCWQHCNCQELKKLYKKENGEFD